ncbi:tetratricopeptide repeat protein [Nostocoides sp. F2B08]|uniref:ATP-binding protein n=1 Tax=Nostocoides sp. F2B08 TaxID=2653936 RepID=UPI00186ADBD9|nr:tetratricopeptide repeat protein [Tetrasphaera sp. F2B08]
MSGPTGTLTMLFSDIEGSTSLLHGLGSRWGEALSAQRRILRAAFEAHDGREMGTEGDSFFVVFTSAQDAVAAAIAGQRGLREHEWPGQVPLRVRIGLHTGEPEWHDDDLIGIDVHRAARIAGAAHGGQIVVSESTERLVAGFGGEFRLRDLGFHRLKDLTELEHLFDVQAPGVEDEHPPIRSLGTGASLPTYATELIGRSDEVAAICESIDMDNVRLVTLTGTGGTGKTRLAVAVAGELERRHARDTYFVPLHAYDRRALMWAGIADVLSAPADAHQSPEERVLDFLAHRSALLVLDNLEQIADASEVVSRLLTTAPGVRILATSRRPLHLADEHLYPVAPLPVPDLSADRRPDELDTGAVALFLRRARMVKPTFALTPANVADVVALCERLDGLPLAIELAAARSRLLSPKALLHRIDDLPTEAVVVGDRSERHRTLWATISWSYDLLDPHSQRALRQLGVFSSRFDLDAVADVVSTDGRDPLDVVTHLIDASLLEIVEGPDGEPMMFMLETIRRFARTRLEESDEHDQVRLAHARWSLQVAAEISSLLTGPRQMSALDRMEAVEEDIRAALDWCLAPTVAPAGERAICGYALLEPMNSYWYRFGYIAEGRGWHERARRLLAGDDVPDSPEVVDALHGQGVLAVQQLDLSSGSLALERALAMAHRLGDLEREARESNSLGIARREAGDLEEARALIERSLSIARRVGDRHREAMALTNVVHMQLDAGDYSGAVTAARTAIELVTALGDPWGVAINQGNLIVALLHSEGPESASAVLREVAADAVALGDTELSIDLLDAAAAVAAGMGSPEVAATLLGTSETQREVAGIPRPVPDQQHLDRFIEPARTTLQDGLWTAAFTKGSSMSIEQTIALATSAIGMPTPTNP